MKEQPSDNSNEPATFRVGEPATFRGEIFTGQEVLALPKKQRQDFAEQVSAKLATKPNTMLQWSPEELFSSMQEGRAAVILNAEQSKLLAFAQVWEYQYDLFKHIPHTNHYSSRHNGVVLEAGSWLSFAPPGTGAGLQVFREVIKAGRDHDPEAMIIGIIEQANARAQYVMEGLGGIKIGEKRSPVLKDPEGQAARMFIYDVTNLSHAILQP